MSKDIASVRFKIENELHDLEKVIDKKKKILKALEEICDHSWVDAPDMYCYHKRESYSRCIHCGKVV